MMYPLYVLYGLLALVPMGESGPHVITQQGKLEGKHFHCKGSGHRYIGFQGIPYAKPPTGNLRFQPPEPPTHWKGIRKATKEGAICVQLVSKPSSRSCSKMLTATLAFPEYFPKLSRRGSRNTACSQHKHKGEEDCLFLNVYTNKIPSSPGKNLQPVMVWIHGGGFGVGSGNKETYGPEFLLKDDVVVVTMNYRLAAFGFLSLGNNDVSGNMGLKDQVMALKWVQQNILKFGGDPGKVTIFGGGTGGMSVSGHMVSPLSKKLFHRAISQSGSVLNMYDVLTSVMTTSQRLAKNIGCAKSTNQLKCLQKKSVSDIAKESLVVNREWAEAFTYYLAFGPVVELPGAPHPYILQHPIAIYRSGKINDVPFMAGVNSNEMIIIKPLMDLDRSYFPERTSLQSTYIPRDLNCSTEDASQLMKDVKNFYFGKKEVGKRTVDEYLKMANDIAFVNENRHMLNFMNNVMQSNIYSYQFSFSGSWNYAKKHVGAMGWKGASQSDDLAYLFKMEHHQSHHLFDKQGEARSISKKMTRMWTNFAKTGNPTSQPDVDVQITWPPYTADNPSTLNIDKRLTVLPQLEPTRADFWDRIYHQYGDIL